MGLLQDLIAEKKTALAAIPAERASRLETAWTSFVSGTAVVGSDDRVHQLTEHDTYFVVLNAARHSAGLPTTWVGVDSSVPSELASRRFSAPSPGPIEQACIDLGWIEPNHIFPTQG